MAPGNPIEHVLERCEELERGFRSWFAAQSPVTAAANSVKHLQAWFNKDDGNDGFRSWFNKRFDGGFLSWQVTHPPDVLTTTMSISSACMGGLVGSLWSPETAQEYMIGDDALLMVAFYEVMILAFGVIDVKSSMAAGFGHGAMFTLMSARKQQPAVALDAVKRGIFHAVCNGAMTLVYMQAFTHMTNMDVSYCQVKSLLADFGLEMYVKNFKNGLLTDATLPLMTDSALKDVKIPSGARLLILDHIQRNPALARKESDGQTRCFWLDGSWALI